MEGELLSSKRRGLAHGGLAEGAALVRLEAARLESSRAKLESDPCGLSSGPLSETAISSASEKHRQLLTYAAARG